MDNDLKEALSALLKAELVPVFKELGGINDQLAGFKDQLGGINSRLDGMDQRLDGMDQRLDRIELEQTQTKQAVLETNETVKRFELIQEQQHSIIELLSARSIDHEAKLKRIL
ncbi:hypothetical protein [Paenibacillus aceris]|uniref:Archaellum component FlaC n=1 Tax=Paenibacillus aceris TaxID=869555 RepID=A0ABS4I4F1_9BACL|nr:hypothetical protein [Paenibacillus aceris]MBP1965788.1 archaellum component FlaC [Paenibacillus aceris]NHW34866.1 hypothetical protein [Paenibacillus aceris]